MSVHAITWVLKKSRSKLGARCVAIVLADHADTYGCESFPAVATIAEEANLSERQVHRALRELEELGEIYRSGTRSNSRGGKPVTIWEFPAISGRQCDKLAGSQSDNLSDSNTENVILEGDILADCNMTNCHVPLKDEPSLINRPVNHPSLSDSSGKARKEKPKRATGDEHFDEFWEAYPKRAGSNPKATALKRFVARVRDDRIDPEVLIAGVVAYSKYCDAMDKTGTELVMHAETFLSPTRRGWEQDWSIPASAGKNGHAGKSMNERSAELAQRFMERQRNS